MNNEFDDFERFLDAYLDHLENDQFDAPSLEGMTSKQRRAAEAFVKSITAARGINPYASRPSLEQLLSRQYSEEFLVRELGEALSNHLRLTIDRGISVEADAASAAVGLSSMLVVSVLGMRIRVVPETIKADLNAGIVSRASDIASVFSELTDTQVVMYTTLGRDALGVVVDRSDVGGAIETPSGEKRAPRLRRPIASPGVVCERWLSGIIPEFKPINAIEHHSHLAGDSKIDPLQLAHEALETVAAAGSRARIDAKRVTWQGFEEKDASRLADIVVAAQCGPMSREEYSARLDEITEKAA